MKLTLLCLTIALVVVQSHDDFTGYNVIRAIPTTKAQLKFLDDFENAKFVSLNAIAAEIDFMVGSSFVGEKVDMLIPPHHVSIVRQLLDERKIEFTVTVDDFQSLVDGQHDTEELEDVSDYRGDTVLSTRRYHNYDEITSYMKQLCRYPSAGANPCTTSYIGRSYEGRSMYVTKVGRDDGRKKIIWIDAGIHAREWIAPAVGHYLLGKLVEKTRQTEEILKKYVFYVMPSMNPDGYAYTWNGGRARMWRKTRTPNRNSRCHGTDPNRNWSFKWGGVGTSPDPCSDLYHGTRAFSEPCTRVASDFIRTLGSRLHLYLSLHSYSQLWLTPWAHTKRLPYNYGELKRAASYAASAQRRVDGNYYRVGATSRILYKCSGASSEWAKGVLGTRYSYTVELPDTGTYGFILPASRIDRTAKGMWAGLTTLLRNI